MRKFGLGGRAAAACAGMIMIVGLSACTSSADRGSSSAEGGSEGQSSGGGSGGSGEAGDLTVGLISHNVASPGIKLYRDVFTRLAEERGWTVQSVDTAGDVVAAVNQTKQWVDEGVDVIVNDTVPNELMTDGIRAANEAGIPWLSVSSGWVEGVTNETQADEFVSGSALATALINEMGGEGNILRLTWSGLQPVRDRAVALDAVVSERPNVKIVETIELKVPGWAEDAYRQVTNYLQTNEDVDAIWMPWDDFAPDVVRAVTESGRDDIIVGGFDLDDAAADLLRQDGPYRMSNALNIPAFAALQVNLAEQAVAGEEVPRISYVPNCLATPDNIPEEGGRDSVEFWEQCYSAPLELEEQLSS